MYKDEEIRSVLLEILRVGLLRIRALGAEGAAEACSNEADHLHNLPWVIGSMGRDTLLFYWNIERPKYQIGKSSDVDQFAPLWSKLGPMIQERT
jgi:hypothetical protein